MRAPMFSNLSSRSISLTTATPSLVTVGAPHAFWIITFRPRGPRVTRAASASRLTPARMPARAFWWRWTTFAGMAAPPSVRDTGAMPPVNHACPPGWRRAGGQTGSFSSYFGYLACDAHRTLAAMWPFRKDIDGRGRGLLKWQFVVIGSRRHRQHGRNVQGWGEGRLSRPWGRSDRGRSDQGDLRERAQVLHAPHHRQRHDDHDPHRERQLGRAQAYHRQGHGRQGLQDPAR